MQHYIPEDLNFQRHHCENLISYVAWRWAKQEDWWLSAHL